MDRRKPRAVAGIIVLALVSAALTAVGGSVTPLVPKASAYYLANGCDEYDPDRGLTYRCTPDRSTFYTPDGLDPTRVYAGSGYSAISTSRLASRNVTVNDPILIPPPAPYRSGRDYCSNSWFGWSAFEGIWQYSCYEHDVCYGSQLGRKYCDVQFWHHMIGACKSHYASYNPARYTCFVDAVGWYAAVKLFGGSHYKPRQTSFEPTGA
jgi:hypothetical protein